MSALDTKIDDLYQLPLDAFTAARNALAKTLTGADAQRVRRLAKPAVVPWAVNQVYWRARATYDRLIKSGERLRKAQIAALEGRSADIVAASEAHRRAVGEAVAEAERIASAAGSRPGADALARTLEALSLAPAPAESPGRLTEPLQLAGFEALAGITPKLQPSQGRPEGRPLRDARGNQITGGSHARGNHVTRGSNARGNHITGGSNVRGNHIIGGSNVRGNQITGGSNARGNHITGGNEVGADLEVGPTSPPTPAERARERAKAEAAQKHAAELKKAEAVLKHAETVEQETRATWERAHDALLDARRRLTEVRNLKSEI